MNANAHEFKNGAKKKSTTEAQRSGATAKTKSTTEARRRSKPIFTTEGHGAELFSIFCEPIEIGLVAFGNFQHDALGQLVGMQLFDSGANALESILAGLNQQKPFFGALHLFFPAIDRFNSGNDVHATRQAALDKRMGNLLSFVG